MRTRSGEIADRAAAYNVSIDRGGDPAASFRKNRRSKRLDRGRCRRRVFGVQALLAGGGRRPSAISFSPHGAQDGFQILRNSDAHPISDSLQSISRSGPPEGRHRAGRPNLGAFRAPPRAAAPFVLSTSPRRDFFKGRSVSTMRLILAGLAYHWRSHFAVALGVAVGTAVLSGALLVGDSVKGSLRDLTIQRLGRIDDVLVAGQFFRSDLVDDIRSQPGFDQRFSAAVGAAMLQGSVERRPDKSALVGQVTVLGVDESFWNLGPDSTSSPFGDGNREDVAGSDNALAPALSARETEDFVVLNEPLASELGVAVGDEVMLRIPLASQIPADSPLGKKEGVIRGVTLTVRAIIPAEGLGRFSLRASQRRPYNAYLPLTTLQGIVGRPGAINAIFVAGKDAVRSTDDADAALKKMFQPTLADMGLAVEPVVVGPDDQPIGRYINITSQQMLLPKAVVEAAPGAFEAYKVQPVITYLANSLRLVREEDGVIAAAGDTVIPYSTVAGVDSTLSLGPLLDESNQPILLTKDDADQYDKIALNDWAADELGAKVGDLVRMTYYRPESTHGEPTEAPSVIFRLAAIVPLARADGRPTLARDPALTPELAGVTDQATIDDWDLPFALVEKIRPQDEAYWTEYRATPKAFVSLATGRRLWSSRFGDTTSLRVTAGDGLTAQQVIDQLRLDPADLGFAFAPVKRDGLAASAGTTDFNYLFLGFSFFLIAAAVMLVALLFQLGVDRRAEQVGVMLACGLPRRRIRRVFTAEAAVVTVAGSLVGTGLGVGYASLMLLGLRTWWLPAIGAPFLELHVTSASLAIGFVAGAIICLLVVAWSLRRLARISVRSLLSGQTVANMPGGVGRAGRRQWIALAAVVLAGVAGMAAIGLDGEAQAGAFFGSGALVLTAILLWLSAQMRSGKFGRATAGGFALPGLAVRNAARNPGRSVLTLGLVASASFLIIAMSAFRLSTSEEGTGGYEILAESSQPIFQDVNSAAGRRELGVLPDDEQLLARVSTLALRVHAGDDASCLNLFRPREPRVLGAPQPLIERGGFAWAGSAAQTDQERANPWLLLDRPPVDERIPVVLDANTATYSLHLGGVGSTYSILDGRGGEVTFEIVGLLANSIFQGSLVVSESNLLKAFPDTAGYRFFLVDVDPPTAAQRGAAAGDAAAATTAAPPTTGEVIRGLESNLSDYGLDATRSEQVLAGYLDVQNTYLLTFQSLGSLGLLLGAFGLATAQLRSALERRGELALMRAAGFARGRLANLVLLENAFLLLGGLGTGVVAALVAVLPHLVAGGASIPWLSLAAMLGVVAIVGLATGLVVVRAILSAPLIPSLSAE